MQVCTKLIEKELTLDTLEAWYEENRTDFYDGNEDPELKQELDNIPDHVQLDVDVYQDEEDKRQQETFIHNAMAMEARPPTPKLPCRCVLPPSQPALASRVVTCTHACSRWIA